MVFYVKQKHIVKMTLINKLRFLKYIIKPDAIIWYEID